jgi:hypothetical protein
LLTLPKKQAWEEIKMKNSLFASCLIVGLALLFPGGAAKAGDALRRLAAADRQIVADNDGDLASGCKKSEYTKGCFGGKTQNCFTITECNNPANNVGETCGQCN